MKRKRVKMGSSDAETTGYNVGKYPLHHFYYSRTPAIQGFRPPLMIEFTGADEWISGCFRRRQNSHIFCLEYVMKGSMKFKQNDQEYLATPGTIFMVRKQADSEMETGPEGFCEKRAMAISGSNLETILTSLKLLDVDYIELQQPQVVEELMLEAEQTFIDSHEGFHSKLSIIAYSTLIALAKEASSSNLPGLLTRAMDLMESRISQPVSLSDLYLTLGVSAATLNRLFKKHLDTTPVEYLIQLKMDFAKQLLADSPLSIKEIADRTGYSNQLYFSAEFKKRNGQSPKQYREEQ